MIKTKTDQPKYKNILSNFLEVWRKRKKNIINSTKNLTKWILLFTTK